MTLATWREGRFGGWRHMGKLAVYTALLLIAAFNLYAVLPVPGMYHDWGAFLESGANANAGLDPYARTGNLTPPLVLPLFQFAAHFDPEASFRAWFISSILFYLAAYLLLIRADSMSSPLQFAYALASAGLADMLLNGQIYSLLLLALASAWLVLRRPRLLVAGVCLGFLIAVKPNFGLILVFLLCAGHLRLALYAGISALP